MDLNQIRSFLALAETLNFTRAAEQCGITQPSLSRQIRHLEEELGGQLVRRERGRTHLTKLGQLIRPRLEEALTQTDAALCEALEFSKLSGETMRVGVMSTIGPTHMVGLVERLAERVPLLDLCLLDATGDALLDMLLAGEIDNALLALPDYPETMHALPLYEERYCIAFKAGHRLERLNGVPFSELAHKRLLSCANSQLIAHCRSQFGSFPISLDARFESGSIQWVQAMTAAGLGYSVVPEFSATMTGVATRPLVEPEIVRTVSLVTVRGRQLSDAERLFHRLCRCSSAANSSGSPQLGECSHPCPKVDNESDALRASNR